MTITKHGAMRFKQRQKIKNNAEMQRKTKCAVAHGKSLKNIPLSNDTRCYLFDGYYYIVSENKERLVTIYRPNKPKTKNKKLLLEDIKIKEFYNELRYPVMNSQLI